MEGGFSQIKSHIPYRKIKVATRLSTLNRVVTTL